MKKLLLISAISLSACVSVPKDAGFSDVQALSAAAFPVPVEWAGQSISDADADIRIDSLLANPLTEDGVIELGMLSSRELRAALYGLKAARGDYVDSASLPNPFLSAVVFDVQGESTTNLEFGGGYELLELLFLPRKIRAGEAGFDAAKLTASEQFIDFALEARLAYYEALASQQMLDLAEQSGEAVQASADTAKAIFDAGNIPEVELRREELLAAEMEVTLIDAKRNARMAKAKLAGLLGLRIDQLADMSLKGRLRNPPKEPANIGGASSIEEGNLALKSGAAHMRASAARMGITNVTSLIGDLELEYARERDHGEWETGYGAGIELPIFNMGQGKREAARARLMAMTARLEGSRRSLGVAAKTIQEDLESAREKALLQRQKILPLAGQVLKGSQLDYNAMQIGVFRLLGAKRDQLAAGQAYIDALKDYWSARARFEHLLAGGTPDISGIAANNTMPSGASDDGGH